MTEEITVNPVDDSSGDPSRAQLTAGGRIPVEVDFLPHQSTHQSGGTDALVGDVDANARVTVRQNTGADIGTRRRINLIDTDTVIFTAADDAGGEELDISADGPDEACRVFHDANQSILSGVQTVLAFNSERFDTDAMHDNVTNNSRITINTAGKYIVACQIRWAVAATADMRLLTITLNGVTTIANLPTGIEVYSNVIQYAQALTTMHDFAAGDFLEAEVLQDSGGALNVTSQAQSSPEFWAHRLS